MNKIIVRQAEIGDLSKIVSITESAYRTPYKDGGFITKPHEPEDLAESFQSKEFYSEVVEIDKEMVGVIRYKIIDSNKLYFYKLAVSRLFRKQGIASFLIERIECIAKKKKMNKILLDCVQEKKLPEYYKKFGYTIDEIKKQHDYHVVYMSKNIQYNE